MKRHIKKAKAHLNRVEITPFPVWKKYYFIGMATIGLTALIWLGIYLIYLLITGGE